jgi:hypothetical protein
MKAVIEQRPSLQQAMYIKPRTKFATWAVSSSEKLLAGPDVQRLMQLETEKGEVLAHKPTFELHPALVVERRRDWIALALGQIESSLQRFAKCDIHSTVVFQRNKPIPSAPIHSALNKMFLSQPPVKHIRVTIMLILNTYGHKVVEYFVVSDNIGITFGQLFQNVRTFIILDGRRPIKCMISCMSFEGGLSVSRWEKQVVEDARVLTWPRWQSDPFGIIEVDEHGHPVNYV